MKKGTITIIVLGSILLSNAICAQNLWTQRASFSGPARYASGYFALSSDSSGYPNLGYLTCGWNSVTDSNYNDLWQYDPSTNSWSQKASLPGSVRRGPTRFVINNIAYVMVGAFGEGALGDFLNDVWAYNPVSNSWQQKSNFPGCGRWGTSAFALNGMGYLVCGDCGSVTESNLQNDVWQYNPTTDSWTQMGNFPGLARRQGLVFTLATDTTNIPNRAFYGTGVTTNSNASNDIWEYNPSIDTWTNVADIPGVPRTTGACFVVQNQAYAGFGTDSNAQIDLNDLYQYQYANNVWNQMSSIPNSGRENPIAFTIGDSAFVGLGYNGTVLTDFYRYVPFINGYNVVSGNIFVNSEGDCLPDSGDQKLVNWIVAAMPGPYYASTDSNGNYQLMVDTGTYKISELPNAQQYSLATVTCPDTGNYRVYFATYSNDTSGFNFGNQINLCPFLTISITTNDERRCFNNYSVAQYCNTGFATAYNVQIHVLLPMFVNLVSTDSSFIYGADSSLIFTIDSVPPGVCGDIHITTMVSCANIDYLGLTACTEAWITPGDTCVLVSASWDRSDLNPTAVCTSGDTVQLTVTNDGAGNMADSSACRVYSDDIQIYAGKLKLPSGAVWSVKMSCGGHTIRIETEQSPYHPFYAMSSAWSEGCGSNIPITCTKGFVTIFPTNNGDPTSSVDCIVINGAWDPNAKIVNPVGLTAANEILPGTQLNYKITFQNTGNAAAQNIVIRDTLSSFLNITTLSVTGSSHPYTYSVSGKVNPVLTFYFYNINLPDSAVDPVNSQGYISFNITPVTGVPENTVINNTASIVFDNNLPVITNPVFNTISTFREQNLAAQIVGNTLVYSSISNFTVPELGITLFPNPNNGQFTIQFDSSLHGQTLITLIDVTGRITWSSTMDNIIPGDINVQPGRISRGVYFLNIQSGVINIVKKIVVE